MWWWTACVYVPVDFADALVVELPLSAPAKGCEGTSDRDGVTVTYAVDDLTQECVVTSTWTGDLVDLDAVRAAIDAKIADYDRDPADVSRVAIQQLDYAIVAASVDVALPVPIQGRLEVVADEPEALVVARAEHDAPGLDWLEGAVVRSTEAGPKYDRMRYEPGGSALLDALTAQYTDGRPFRGAVVAEVRVPLDQTGPLAAAGDFVLHAEARVAIGATMWTHIP